MRRSDVGDPLRSGLDVDEHHLAGKTSAATKYGERHSIRRPGRGEPSEAPSTGNRQESRCRAGWRVASTCAPLPSAAAITTSVWPTASLRT